MALELELYFLYETKKRRIHPGGKERSQAVLPLWLQAYRPQRKTRWVSKIGSSYLLWFGKQWSEYIILMYTNYQKLVSTPGPIITFDRELLNLIEINMGMYRRCSVKCADFLAEFWLESVIYMIELESIFFLPSKLLIMKDISVATRI